MWLRVLERFLNSTADAWFWILIIFSIGVTLAGVVQWVIEYLLIDTDRNKNKNIEEDQ